MVAIIPFQTFAEASQGFFLTLDVKGREKSEKKEVTLAQTHIYQAVVSSPTIYFE